MKKIILSVFAIIALCSCEKSNEDKVRELIESQLKTTMKDWSSYEFVEMSPIDSTFTLFMDTPEGKKYRLKRDSIMKIRAQYESNIMFSDLYGSKRVKEMRDSLPILEKMEKSITERSIKAEKAYKGDFTGYRVRFVCRGNNSFGAKVINKAWFFINKDFTKITNQLSID